MEEKEKALIQFSTAQFILLMGIGLVLLVLAFLLGGRFGPSREIAAIAPQPVPSPYQALAPTPSSLPPVKIAAAPPTPQDRLVDTVHNEAASEAEVPVEDEDEIPPRYRVTAQGDLVREDEPDPPPRVAEAVPEPDEVEVAPPRLAKTLPLDRNTMVRFKSGALSRFTVEVNEYFDEISASKKIQELQKKGYEAYLSLHNIQTDHPSYVVRVGAFSERKLAEDFATTMSNQQGLELQVVPMD